MVLTNNYKSSLLLFICLCLTLPSFAQKKGRYLVYFKDKKNTPYSLSQAEAFLSARSLQRRRKQAIQVNGQDLPVNPSYIKAVQNLEVKVNGASRWLNAALVEAEANQLDKLKSLDFVWKISDLLIDRKAETGEDMDKSIYKDPAGEPPALSINDTPDYGKSLPQVQMLGADQMHQEGFRGKGMLIAVLDAGFVNVDDLSYFRHLFENGQIKDAYDFVEYDNDPYHGSDHGLMVLSTIAAYKPGEIIGTAPEASFLLYRTEDSSSEFRIEEINWLMAAERADSAGVDVINSSLGYTTFDDPNQDYTYEMMDGNTALISRAADWAAARGILVVSSAGNEGGVKWKYIAAPADADSIMSVGAVGYEEKHAYFSSYGPSSDGQTKPDVAAVGYGTVVVDPDGKIRYQSGTSFSSPLVCGFVASCWQAFPDLNNMQLIEAIRKSSSQAGQPDDKLGYGIPNYKRLKAYLKENSEKIR